MSVMDRSNVREQPRGVNHVRPALHRRSAFRVIDLGFDRAQRVLVDHSESRSAAAPRARLRAPRASSALRFGEGFELDATEPFAAWRCIFVRSRNQPLREGDSSARFNAGNALRTLWKPLARPTNAPRALRVPRRRPRELQQPDDDRSVRPLISNVSTIAAARGTESDRARKRSPFASVNAKTTPASVTDRAGPTSHQKMARGLCHLRARVSAARGSTANMHRIYPKHAKYGNRQIERECVERKLGP